MRNSWKKQRELPRIEILCRAQQGAEDHNTQLKSGKMTSLGSTEIRTKETTQWSQNVSFGLSFCVENFGLSQHNNLTLFVFLLLSKKTHYILKVFLQVKDLP
jgi:hypothetical protein